MKQMRLNMTPPRVFAVSSLLLIAATAAVTSFTQSSFFRHAIIDREAMVVRDIATAVVREEMSEQELSLSDLEGYADTTITKGKT